MKKYYLVEYQTVYEYKPKWFMDRTFASKKEACEFINIIYDSEVKTRIITLAELPKNKKVKKRGRKTNGRK